MIRKLLLSAILPVFLQFSAALADDEVQADVQISIKENGEIWTGQQVTLNLDLKTTGFSFSNSHFNLPEVGGAFLMQTDTTTIKLTENVNGVVWQVIRYPLALYPQKAGLLEIPPIDVRFVTSAGFGSAEKAFEFQAGPLQLSIKSPPGIKPGDLVITTTSFELDYNWQPQTGATQTGDAITLTVNRRAEDISAMLLPPLPVYRTEGLAAYPQAPEINDKTNRGDLTGERTDSIIWVIETPGSYNIPGIRFQWWDPNRRELKQQIIPGIKLDIPVSPLKKITTDSDNAPGQSSHIYFWLLVIVFTALIAVLLWQHFARKTPGRDADNEKAAFSNLKKACNSNNFGQTYSALHVWLRWHFQPNTLKEFAEANNDTQLGIELKRLQESLISSDSNWTGSNLLHALRRTRGKIIKQKNIQEKTQLAPLNP